MTLNKKYTISNFSLFSMALVLLCVISLVACKKEPTEEEPKPMIKRDIYVVGSSRKMSEFAVGKIWINGVASDLTGGAGNIYPLSVYVDDNNNVYVAGYEEKTGGTVAKLWKNGVSTNLTNDKSGFGSANYVYGSGSDIYVVGYYDSSFGHIAKLWKNGVDTKLGGAEYSRATSVYVEGTDFYIAGYEWDQSAGTPYLAKFWKNGVPTLLGNAPSKSLASSVFVSGSDVYVLGHENGAFKIWKNKTGNVLPESTTSWNGSVSLFVSGSDVFVAGYRSGISTIWKNGVPSKLSGDATTISTASSVFVLDSDVYVAGYDYKSETDSYVAKLWLNGTDSNLVKYSENCIATAVFVK